MTAGLVKVAPPSTDLTNKIALAWLIVANRRHVT